MLAATSIFFDINLPNAATWFYFSALLALALFFKFGRLLSMRNLDLLTVFLPMPGLLLLLQEHTPALWGYLWLFGASICLLARCLVDLALERRPALGPNLTLGGLTCLGVALFASLVAVAVRQPGESTGPQEPSKLPIDRMRQAGEDLLRQQTPAARDDPNLERDVKRGLTLLCHLAIVIGLVLVGWRHFEDVHAGVAAATFYLLLPYTYLLMPGTRLGLNRWDHAWPMALMIWMVLAYRRPLVSGLFMGLAVGTVFFPLLTFPVWLSFYWGRGAYRFVLSTLLATGLTLAVFGTFLWLHGELPPTLQSSWSLSAWQPWKQPAPSTEGLWQGTASHWAYRQPIAVAYLAFLITILFWPMPKNLAHVLALSTAVLVGLQLWYADQGGIYVLWYLPYLLLLVFRPNLSSAQPSASGEDWLLRRSRASLRMARRLLHLPAAEDHPIRHVPQASP